MDHNIDANKMVAIGALLEKADSKLNARAGYQSNQLRHWFDSLMNRGTVEGGWRESCGTTDLSAKIRAEWVKVTKRLQKAGIHFVVERVKHNNGWATKCGGFWHSEIFTIPTVKESMAARTTEHFSEVQTK